MTDELQNIIDYIYGMKRDIEIFLKQHEVNEDCKRLLNRMKYQLEQTEKMLEELEVEK